MLTSIMIRNSCSNILCSHHFIKPGIIIHFKDSNFVVKKGEEIRLVGFGTFVRAKRQARRGRNPQTGESMMLGARKVVTFKPSGLLRKKMNSK